eukprot:1631540-Pyramimonas_sp.AAC.1
MHHDPPTAANRAAYLQQRWQGKGVVCLQETHGSTARLADQLRLVGYRCRSFASFGQNDLGGVVTVFPYTSAEMVNFEPRMVVRGRVLRVKATLIPHSCDLIVWNIHNLDLQASQQKYVADRLQEDLLWAGLAPRQRSILVMGDFNFRALPADPEEAQAAGRREEHGPRPPRHWRAGLRGYTELQPAEPTHWVQNRGTYSSIDRIYVGAPQRLQCQ